MICPATSPRLLALIERARHHRMTPAEKAEQRVSFVYGQIGGTLSKDAIRAMLYGEAP